jgi:eukaryotic-like serine/threonine-protein kinase
MPHVTPLHADDPSRVGRYRLTGRIAGMPGTGPVYLAQTADGSDVMITLLAGEWTADPAERDRFTAEANAASRVAPFCATRILDAGFEGSQAFLVSEYVAGPSLAESVAEDGPWEEAALEALAIGTATGLAAIHQAGLVHGDFGPQYVVLGSDGPRVIEFGITPPYGSATPAADMRAWAQMVLYAAIGGPGDPAYEDLELLPEPLRMVVSRCLSGAPGEQLSAREAVIELLGDADPPAGVLAEGSRRAAAAAAPATPAEDPAGTRRTRTRRTVMIWWAAGVAACILAIAVAIRIAQDQSGGSGQPPGAVKTTSPTPGPTPSPSKSLRPSPAATVPGIMVGSWSGQVSQTSPSDVFNVQVSLSSGAIGGSVHYSGTSFSCSGDLSPVSGSSTSVTLNQAILKGPCAGGVVTLSPGTGDTLLFRFKGKTGPTATGTLAKST